MNNPTPPVASVIQVIHVIKLEGHGTEAHPYREVDYYLTLDGQFLAARDKHQEDKWRKPNE